MYKLDKHRILDKNEPWKIEQRATSSTFHPNELFMEDLGKRVGMKKLEAIEKAITYEIEIDREHVKVEWDESEE